MQNKTMIAAVLLSLGVISAFAGKAQPQRGASSSPNPGIEARFSFGPGEFLNGTRVVRVFLELSNTSDVGNPIYLLYDSLRSIKALVRDSGGKPVPVGTHAADISSPLPFLICLPYHGTLRFDVTAVGYIVPGAPRALIGLISGVWTIQQGDSSDYYLTGTYVAEKPTTEPLNGRIWTGTLEIPKARVDQPMEDTPTQGGPATR